MPNPGGGRPALEYLVADLPEAARETLALRAVAIALPAADSAESRLAARVRAEGAQATGEARLVAVDRLDDAGRGRMDARLWALDALARYASAAGQSEPAARDRFADALGEGEITVPPEHVRWLSRKGDVAVSTRSLARWAADVKASGEASLAGSYGRRSGRSYERAITLDNELGRVVIAMLAQRGEALGPWDIHKVATGYAQAGRIALSPAEVPSEKTFERFLIWLKGERPTTWATLVDPQKAKGQVQPAFGSRTEAVERINEVWELDSTLADVVLEDTDWKTGEVVRRRFAVCAAIDVFSRRVRFLVTDRSKSDAIAALLRRCILEWGIPEEVRMDNGKDYTSKHLELVLRELHIKRSLCRPYSGDEKGAVERVIGTLQHDCLFKLLPGYAGHDVSARKALDARRRRTAAGEPPLQLGEVNMDRAKFQEFVEDWALGTYANRTHSETHRKPVEMAMLGGRARWVKSPAGLDLLMARPAGSKGGIMTVQRKGIEHKPAELKGAPGRFYFVAPELARGEWISSGKRVLCREDLTDLGRLHVADADSGEFVCWAVCPQLADVDRQQVAILAKTAYLEERARVLADAKQAAADFSVATALEAVRTGRAEATGENRIAGQIAPAQAHETPALAQAERAAQARRPAPRVASEPTADELAEAASVSARVAARRAADEAARDAEVARGEAVLYDLAAVSRKRLYADDGDRYLALSQRLGRGEALSAAERDWFAAFEQRGTGRGPARTA